jgi:Fe2+ transport system protein FeoA
LHFQNRSAAAMRRPLTELAPGETGRLCEPSAGAAVSRRLLDLGFVPGTTLKVLRRAPLGDPIEIEIRGYRICLRREQLRDFAVEPASAEGPR